MYNYVYARLRPGDEAIGVDIKQAPSTASWASHAAEMIPLYGSAMETEDRAIRDYWGAFVRDGAPAGRGRPHAQSRWPPVGEGVQLVFNSSGLQEVSSWAAAVESCRLWNVVVPALIS